MSDTQFKYALGSTVKHKITGYTGIITNRSEWLHGCRTYTVQAQTLHEGKPVDPVGSDEDALELVMGVPEIPANFKFELGSKVRDTLSTYEGIIIGRVHWLHTSSRYQVQTQELKNGVPVKSIGCDEGFLENLVEAEPHVMKATGGPGDEVSARQDPSRF